MEATSGPMLHSPRFDGGATRVTIFPSAITTKVFFHTYPRSHSPLLFRGNCNYDGFLRKIEKRRPFDRLISNNSTSENTAELTPSQKLAVLLEVEGVLMDIYRLGNRQAFNVAFRKLGLDCANWSEPVYVDLFRKSAGDEERMLILFFNRIGWPTSVATSEKGNFMKNVFREKACTRVLLHINECIKFIYESKQFLSSGHPDVAEMLINCLQKNALDDLVMSKAFSLRPGAEEFIDDAFEKGIPVIILTAYSKSGEKVARSIAEKLGTDRLSKVKIVGDEDVKKSFYGQLVFGTGVSSSLDEQLAKEVTKAASAERQRIAEEVALMLKLKVELNRSSSESLQNIVAALRAGAEYAETPLHNCVLVAGSQLGVSAAERIGMPCVVLRSSSTSRAEFPSAIAIMDGFGGADLSISRLERKLSSSSTNHY